MLRRGEPSARKRRSSDSKITQYFNTTKRERSHSETKNNVSQKLEETPCAVVVSTPQKEAITDSSPLYSEEELRLLLGVKSETSITDVPFPHMPAGLENLPRTVYTHIFTILDLGSVSALALASNIMSTHVKCYVADQQFYRRIQMDNLDFMNCSFRPEDPEFLENDPFTACGALIKSITITLDTKIRAQVFLNICRNLRRQLGGSLNGFGRLLEKVTQFWKFSERRVMVKAAILIDSDLRRCLLKVLTAKPGQYVGLEMKVRSELTDLFLNRTQEVDEACPNDIVEFGAWLSILLRNVVEKYQGKLYYILFGPTIRSRFGERVDWAYFCIEKTPSSSTRKNDPNFKMILVTLLNGIRALRIMNNSELSDMSWCARKIYQLFLRIIEVCEMQGTWSEKASSMALAIDTSGLFIEYLLTCLDPRRTDSAIFTSEAAEMVCLVRAHLYRWTANPATFLAEPLHHAFNHLAQLDGHYGGLYKTFFDKIWETQKRHLMDLVAVADSSMASNTQIRNELDGQLSTVRLFSDISDAALLQRTLPQPHAQNIARHPLEEDEQQE